MKHPDPDETSLNEASGFDLRQYLNRMEVRIAVKAGVAACLSLYAGVGLAMLLDRPDYLVSGTWCVLSTFVVLQAHLGGTYRAAWIRFLGVLIGSFMGGLFTSIFGSNAITLGVSVVFTVLILSSFKIKESIRIACLSLSVVMILWGLHPEMNPWRFGFYRFLDSTAGILIAVLISHTLWPTQAVQKMRINMATTLAHLNRLFQLMVSLKPPPKNIDRIYNNLNSKIKKLLQETRQFLHDSELELLTKTRSIEEWEHLVDHLENIFDATKKLNAFQEFNVKKILDKKLTEKLMTTMETSVESFKCLVNELRGKKRKKEKPDLRAIADTLEDELSRFRMTRTTRQFNREDVELFFVFFYNLRAVIEELIKINDKIAALDQR